MFDNDSSNTFYNPPINKIGLHSWNHGHETKILTMLKCLLEWPIYKNINMFLKDLIFNNIATITITIGRRNNYFSTFFRKQEVLKKRWERMKVLCMVNGCICWRYQPPLWVFPPPTWGMWPCINVITSALGHMYVYSNWRAVKKVNIYTEFHVNRFKHNINHCWEKESFST